MTVINTNVKSLIAQNALKINNREMFNSMEQLSTGRRINSAKDDAAGLALTQNMTAQIRGLDMAVRNANDGISPAQTAEGAMVEISNMLQRMRELAVQAATGTLSTTQQGYLDTEFQALNTQIASTITNTEWNGLSLLSTADVSFTIQTGADQAQTVVVTSKGLATSTYSSNSLTTVANASAAIGTVSTGLEAINSARATLGAAVNRLTSAADNLTNVWQNLSESRSRVLDTDYAKATSELGRTQIIQQAATAVLAQANTSNQSVLKLLQG